MSLYVCDHCGTVDNTALGDYWLRVHPWTGYEPLPPRCTRCATGEWHGKFPEEKWDGKRKVINR